MVGNVSLRVACSHLTASEQGEGYHCVCVCVRACHLNRLYSGNNLLPFHVCISVQDCACVCDFPASV